MEIILMLAGGGIIYILIGKLYIKYWFKGLSADIKFDSESAVAGDRVNLLEVVKNQKWLPIHFINVKFQLDKNLSFDGAGTNSNRTDRSYKNDVFSLMFYQKITRTIPLICERRGYYAINKIEIISMGAFMNDILSVTTPIESELLVYPPGVDMQTLQIPYRKILGNITANTYTYEDPFTFKGIRDYQSYDSMDKINWKATARTGDMKVNIHDFTLNQQVCILLNLESEGMLIDEELLEISISIASSLAQLLQEKGVSISLISNGRDILTGEELSIESGGGLSHINTINAGLARINLREERKEFSDILDECRIKITDQVLYVLISAAKKTPMQENYDRICAVNGGSVWIIPYRQGTDWQPRKCRYADLISWEAGTYETLFRN